MALNITKEVANMERLSVGTLCERYREVFGEDTKARNKQWLIKRIAWKLQANEEGDISERARKLAMEIAQSSDIRTSAPKIRTRPIEATFETATTIITPPADSRLPVAGTVLMNVASLGARHFPSRQQVKHVGFDRRVSQRNWESLSFFSALSAIRPKFADNLFPTEH